MQDRKDIEFVDYIQSYFKQAYLYATPYLERKDMIQRAFDGIIDSDTWATMSEINIPLLRTAVLQAVPFIMDYLFPDSKFVELVPRDANVSFDQVQKVEQVLEDMLINKMKIKRACTLISQDAVKFGCGYGEVRRVMTSQPTRELVRFFENGEQKSETTRMNISAPTEQLDLRWIPYECVIPTPDGDMPDECTCVFHMDTMKEDQFRAMFAEDSAMPSDQRILSGSVEEIIKRTRTEAIDAGYFPIWFIATHMTGDNTEISRLRRMSTITRLVQGYDKHKAPVVVPILKCYFRNEHVWLANGDTVIYHVKGGIQTMQCPVIKANASIDGGNWYAQSDVSASKDLSDGIITFKNALMDLLTLHLHPTTVYDERAISQPNKMPDIEPYSKIGVFGKVGESISYLKPPDVGQAVFAIGGMLEQDHSASNGQPLNLGGQGTAGLMRGGSGAFESLLQSVNGRQEMLGALLEMDLMEPVIMHTLLHMQMMDKEEFSFTGRKDKEFFRTTATMSEIRNAFDVRLNLRGKMRGGINEQSMAIARYLQVLRGNPYVDPKAALETVVTDPVLMDRLWATPEQVKSNIEMARQMQEPKQGMGGTQGEQAVMGGASQRSAQ